MHEAGAVRLAVDIGGTFTDVVLNDASRQLTTKLLTTHEAPAAGVMAAIEQLLEQSGTGAGDVGSIIHGTTLVANTIIERQGARTALLATEGHRDALETAYENRFDQYDLSIDKPAPLVARRFRWPVRERISAAGEILLELDEASIDSIIENIDRHAIESVAIGFLHAYANPLHEQQVAKRIRQALPNIWLSLSSEISPQIREYERLSTTAANAYVQPLVAGYLGELEQRLNDAGINCPLLLVMSTGGLTTPEIARKFPIRLAESGPSGGAILAATIAQQANIDEVLSFDMGGTTAKLCLVDGGNARRANAFEIDRLYRFIRGSGLPLNIPTIEMVEIGAGGGSLARIDELQRLRVGPGSAGSEPGPACYQRGGTQPAVTDADLLLGYINACEFAGGEVALSMENAGRAVDTHVAEALQISTTRAAYGINEVVDEAMANASRVHALESGQDVSVRTLIAFGGAAPLHAARLAEKLGIDRIIIPHHAGVGSAVGFLLAPVSFEIGRTRVTSIAGMNKRAMKELVAELKTEALQLVRNVIGDNKVEVTFRASLRYSGQGHEVGVALNEEQLLSVPVLRSVFEEHYRLLYGRLIDGVDIELVTVVVLASEVRKPRQAEHGANGKRSITAGKSRPIYTGHGGETIEVASYARNDLQPGDCFSGPALITEAQTTTLVPQTMEVGIDEHLHIIMQRKTGA